MEIRPSTAQVWFVLTTISAPIPGALFGSSLADSYVSRLSFLTLLYLGWIQRSSTSVSFEITLRVCLACNTFCSWIDLCWQYLSVPTWPVVLAFPWSLHSPYMLWYYGQLLPKRASECIISVRSNIFQLFLAISQLQLSQAMLSTNLIVSEKVFHGVTDLSFGATVLQSYSWLVL